MMHDWSTMKRLIYLRGNPATGGGGGSPLTVTGPTPLLMPGAVAKPMRKAEFAISPVQAGSGDPSPSNVRPITGWTGANCYVTGGNLFDEEWEIGAINKFDGQNLASSSSVRTKNFIAFKPGISKITISWDAAETGSIYALAMLYKTDKTFSRYYGAFTNSGFVLSLNADEAYLRFYLYNRTTPIVDCMVNYGTSATPYTPYSGTTVSVAFPASVGTVYGGTVDPVTGQGVVTHMKLVFDGVNNVFNDTISTIGYRGSLLTQGVNTPSSNVDGELYCDRYKCIQAVGEWNCYITSNGHVFAVITSEFETLEAFNENLINNPITIVYELATPIPFTIPPQSLTPPAGDAYIWADCGGSAEVTYIGKA